jgi:iduronate 2-sulfatase
MKKLLAFLLLPVLVVLQVPISLVAQKKPAKKYNVVLIISDDLRPELGSYGNPLIKTPNVDRIAKRATKFDRAYTQYPLCNPSRTSFLTGRYPTQHKIYNSNDYFRRKYPDWVTMPQYFQKNGYVTLRSGKIFHGGIDDQVSWTEGGEPTDPAITERGRPGARQVAEADRYDGNEGRNPAANRQSGSDRIVVLEGDGSDHGDYKAATRAIGMIERNKEKPFFLAVGFVKPHSPPTAPRSFFDLYDVNKMPLPVDFAEKPKAPAGFPEVSIAQRNADLFIGRDSPPDLAREMIRAYHASTSFMDAQVGRVLDSLEKNGLRDDTIVVFFGDHGYHLGEKGKWSKAYSLYEINLRVPLFIAVPKGKTQTTTAPVQLQDLYRTLSDLCGLPAPPANIEGRSIASLIRSPRQKWDHPAYSMMEMADVHGLSVRKNNWHFVEYDQGASGEMLFDIEKDPNELKNLANDPSYAKVVAELRTLVRKMPTENK